MPHFACKICGVVTDDPEIVPHPDEDAHYRELAAAYKRGPSALALMGMPPFNHSITCPVCLGVTRFWRETPFPVEARTYDDGTPMPLSVRQMLKDMER